MRSITKLALSCLVIAFLTGCCCQRNRAEKSGKWEVLFDGKSVEHWRGYNRTNFPDKGWTVEDGTLKTIPHGDVVDLITRDEYENFELELEWRISPAGNSGVMYHVAGGDPATWHTGPEMQILDDAKYTNKASTLCGALYDLVAPANKHLAPVGDWNKVRILVNGNHVEYWLNGYKVVEYELNSPELTALIANSKFKDHPRFAKMKTGYIALQFHHDEVWFRHIKVRRL
jgi:hypothetical protein